MNFVKRQLTSKHNSPTGLALDGKVVRAGEVTDDQRDQMFELMCRYYDNMCRATFDKDLDEKDWVILATHPQSQFVLGFSTQLLIDMDGVSKPTKVLFSGDTIIDRNYWARNPLAQIWGRLSLNLVDNFSEHELYWFLISKGFRTYRFLPVFFKEFFPHCVSETPGWAQGLIDRLGLLRYPVLYRSNEGVVKASEFGCKLRPGIADIIPRLENKHIRYFHEKNAGHADGDELCCLARLSRENFKRGAFRIIGDYNINEWSAIL